MVLIVHIACTESYTLRSRFSDLGSISGVTYDFMDRNVVRIRESAPEMASRSAASVCGILIPHFFHVRLTKLSLTSHECALR